MVVDIRREIQAPLLFEHCARRFFKAAGRERYGNEPVNGSYRTTPSEKTSVAVVIALPRICSGLA